MKLYRFVENDNQTDFNSRKRNRGQVAANKIDAAIKDALWELSLDAKRQSAFMHLLACVRARTSWLQPTSGQGSVGWNTPVFFINRLRNVAARQNFWLRSCESWTPKAASPRIAFRSLVHHLFANYLVPGFMDSVWDLPPGPEAFGQQVWFIRLGRGAMLRSLSLPLPLTRRMEHFARQAPDHYTATQAIRYGEARGLGCTQFLANAIVESRLGQRLTEPSFWRTVLLFLAAHPGFPSDEIRSLIDFIHAIKFAGEEVLSPEGPSLSTPPWPAFSMQGRTVRSVLRLLKVWNGDMTSKVPVGNVTWSPAGVPAYRYIETSQSGERLDWTIVELLNSTALYADGKSMCHCVYTYTGRCLRNESRIWSLRLRVGNEQKRRATIEVDPKRRAIIQVRAKRNRHPGRRSTDIIQRWAASAGLKYEAAR